MCNMGPRSDAHTLELAGVLERCFLGQYHGFRYWVFSPQNGFNSLFLHLKQLILSVIWVPDPMHTLWSSLGYWKGVF